MSLAKKLNLKEGMKVRVLGKPADMDLGDLATTTSAKAEGVLVFVKTLAEVEAKAAPAIAAAKADGLAWIAYPKAKQLGTDLNRDILWQHLLKEGIQGVRQVALDEQWSAMRFRPKK
jgi:phage-related baseplate assembly protein